MMSLWHLQPKRAKSVANLAVFSNYNKKSRIIDHNPYYPLAYWSYKPYKVGSCPPTSRFLHLFVAGGGHRTLRGSLCADARRGLVPSGTRRAVPCPRLYPGSPPRSEPRLLSARTLRGSVPPRPRSPSSSASPPGGLSARRPLSFPLSSSLLLPDGVSSSEPRSVRADVIPGSERYAAHRHASAGRGSVPRRPGERREASPGRPSCGACEISRPRKPGSPARI